MSLPYSVCHSSAVPSALGVRSMGYGSCAHAPVAAVSSSAMMNRNLCFIVLIFFVSTMFVILFTVVASAMR